MDYFVEDKPCPRGEILIRGPSVSSGYYKDPVKTKEDFDDEGWFHTGDVGEFTRRGTLKVIDRKKNIFKLAIGEYVAPEKLENLYAKSKYVNQIWIYGDSFQRYIVAVISVNSAAIRNAAKQNAIKVEAKDQKEVLKSLCNDDEIRQIVLLDLKSIAAKKKLQGFEVIKDTILVNYEFNVDNDYATPTLKLKRHQLTKAFKERIDGLYVKLNEAEKILGFKPSKGEDKEAKLKESPKKIATPRKVNIEEDSVSSETPSNHEYLPQPVNISTKKRHQASSKITHKLLSTESAQTEES